MAFKRLANGQYVISSKAEAVRAMTMVQNIQTEIAEIEKEHGIDEMKVDATELKKAATAYCDAKNIELLEMPEVGKIARLIRAVGAKRWIGTKEDIDDKTPAGVKPLRSLVDKETWMKITTRIPDPVKIDEAIAEGVITAKAVAPAYIETTKAPYLGVYNA